MLGQKSATKEELAFYEQYLKRSLFLMEQMLTKHTYLCGDQKTIADLSACHELDQTAFIQYDLSKYPRVQNWLSRMIDEDPVVLETSKVMRKLAQRSTQRAKL